MNREQWMTRLWEVLETRAGLWGVFLGGGLCAMLCSAALWSWPAWQRLQLEHAGLALREQEIAALQQQGAGLRRELRDAEKNLAEYRQRARGLPLEPDIAGFSQALDRTAGEHGVRLLGITPGRVQRQDFYAVTPLQLELMGQYAALHGFLGGLIQLPRVLQLDFAELHASGEEAQLRAELSLQLYCCAAERPGVEAAHPPATTARTQTAAGAGGNAPPETAHTQTAAAGENAPPETAHTQTAQTAAPGLSPFRRPTPGRPQTQAQEMEEVGSIRHGGRHWRLLRDSQGRVHRRESRTGERRR